MGKAVTINDVAREAGVSKTTAVFVLNNRPGFSAAEGTRIRVREAAQKLGYRRSGLARALSTGRIYTVGVVLRIDSGRPQDWVYSKDVLAAMARACHKARLRLTLIPFSSDAMLSVDDVADQRVDGLILVSHSADAFARQIYASGFPTVSIGSGYAERLVDIDQRGGVREATEHLLALGHTKIGYVLGSNPGIRAVEERRAGYMEAMQAAGLAPQCYTNHEAQACLTQAERPTAFVTYNDDFAWQLTVAARQVGLRIPDDLSVIGFDNTVLAETAVPPLTTIENPLDAQAERALKVLQCLLQGKESPTMAPLATRLIHRQSTAAPSGFSPQKEPKQ
ncbi:LacI family DNA-binding transcriptional regulator [Armatimonas sp.]|uniref:LacI family DNA-binding transcriptional regulator n=1 Tax=Armatimonas sp. TaxID=1872638 RepID=UPI00286B46F5|nr:LacI family DNA-binding transcriptional regulator [Armatimonas sp.]